MIIKTSDINHQVRNRIIQLIDGIDNLTIMESLMKNKFPIKRIIHSQKLAEIIKDPLYYLGDKVGMPSCKSINEIVHQIKDNSRSRAVLNTTISANIRSVYEAWTLCTIIYKIGTKLLYPNNDILYLGKTKENKMNNYVAIVETKVDKKLAFFLETSIPSKININPNSGGLRPDIIILPFKKDVNDYQMLQPDINFIYDKVFTIIECKESTSWPWTTKFIYNPLKNTKEKIKVTHLEMLKYYSKVYDFRNFFVVSRLATPQKAQDVLASEKITLFDEIGFNHEKLDYCVKSIEDSDY